MERVQQMERVQSNALDMFRKKNADYGDAFAKFGVVGVLMRIEDKIQRALSITKNGEPIFMMMPTIPIPTKI